MQQLCTALAAMILLLCLAAAANAATAASLQFLDQCGGKGGNCGLFTCQDGPYETASCAAGLSCVRHNAWYHQCMPVPEASHDLRTSSSSKQHPENPSPQHQQHPASAFGTLAVFGQCGGRGGDCGVKKVCVDSMYPQDTCPAGTSCMRHSEWYWQCVPTAAVTVDSHVRLAAGSAGAGAAQQTSSLSAGTASGLIKGATLVLDVGSLTKHASNQLPIVNAEQCSLYCHNTRGCTAWSFCNSAAGCGTGCRDYIATNPAFTTSSFYSALSNPLMYMAPEIHNFGPFGKTSGCTAAATSGKWPLGMCSLKVLTDSEQPEFESQEEGDGWVSGWFSTPAACANLSPKACQRCLSSINPEACFKCAKLLSTKTSLLESVIAGPMLITATDGCL